MVLGLRVVGTAFAVDPRFSSQHPHGGLQLAVCVCSSKDLASQISAPTGHIDIHSGTHTAIFNK